MKYAEKKYLVLVFELGERNRDKTKKTILNTFNLIISSSPFSHFLLCFHIKTNMPQNGRERVDKTYICLYQTKVF